MISLSLMPYQKAKFLEHLSSLQTSKAKPEINSKYLLEYISTLNPSEQVLANLITTLARDSLLEDFKRQVRGDVGEVLLKFSLDLGHLKAHAIVLDKVDAFSPTYVVYLQIDNVLYRRFETEPTLSVECLSLLIKNYYNQGLTTLVSDEEYALVDSLEIKPR